MDLTIKMPDEDAEALKIKASVAGVSPEQYIMDLLRRDLAPEWLRQSWANAKETGLDQLSMDEIDAEIAASRKARRDFRTGS